MDGNASLGQIAPREFFLWAIFLDRLELAKYLCSKTWVTSRLIHISIATRIFLQSQNQSIAPLIATRIYRIAATIALHSVTKEYYENNAKLVLTYHHPLLIVMIICFQTIR